MQVTICRGTVGVFRKKETCKQKYVISKTVISKRSLVMAEILKGAPVAEALSEAIRNDVEELKAKGIIPTLAIVRVGERPDDLAY